MKMIYECECGPTIKCRLELDVKLPIKYPSVCPFDGSVTTWKVVEPNTEIPAATPEPEQKEVLPDWCQLGAKVFVNDQLNVVGTIHKIVDENEIEIDVPNGPLMTLSTMTLTPAILMPWTKDTGPDGFIDENKKEWRKCPSFDSKMEWGYIKIGDKCWCPFNYVMSSHKQASGEPCGEYVRKEHDIILIRPELKYSV